MGYKSVREPTVLLVEDQQIDAKLVSMAVKRAKLDVNIQVARNGLEALQFLEKGNTVDLILLDINMPIMDGKEFLKTLRGSGEQSSTIVIMYTSSDDEADIEQCYSLGANGYVCKQVGIKEITAGFQAMFDFWFNYSRIPNGCS